MVQHTLHRYFHSQRPVRPPPKTTFLHLPFNVRREIYLLSGLPADSTVYLNYIHSSKKPCIQQYDLHDLEHWPTEPRITPRSQSLVHFLDGHLPWPQVNLNRHCECIDEGPNEGWRHLCTCDPLPWQLLYVSKAISDEVSSIFYSDNHFSIFRDSLGGLSGLNSIPRAALGTMRSLSICLNYVEQDSNLKGRKFGPESWDVRCHALCAGSKQQQLFTKAKRHDEAVSVKELHKLCRLLQAHVQPNHLKLSFICDVADVEIAEQVIRPLSHLPLLRECSIRLGFLHFTPLSEQIPLLQQLARKTADAMTHRPNPKAFRYTDLPTEIQLQILSHTSLITPYSLIWGLNTEIASTISSPFFEPRTFPYLSYPSASECCSKCSPSPASRRASLICSCWTAHAAFSSTCTCWRFPLSFFLVSKRMKDQAESIFYGRNDFWILPKWRNGSRKLEIWNFLTWIPAYAKRYLRSLTWEMTWNVKEEWHGYLRDGNDTYHHWRAALEMLAALPQNQLALTISTNFSQGEIYYANGGWEYGDSGVVVPDSVYVSEAEHTLQVSRMIARDLVERGVRLRDLFWHFEWPMLKDGKGKTEERGKDTGRELEKMVMGPVYDGEERGKLERRQRWNGWMKHQPPW